MGKQKKRKKKEKRKAAVLPQPDAVDEIVDEWALARPDLDATPVAVVSRVGRLAARFSQQLDETCVQHGLTKANYEALAALARSGNAGTASQARLMRALDLTPGTVSVRVTRLVEEGYVERLPDPESPRAVIVAMTDDGKAAFERVVHAHLATQRRLLAPLDGSEQLLLADLLRRLMQQAGSAA